MTSFNTEMELVEQAKKGDKQALTEIVTRNEKLVYNTALKLLANEEEAECVLQETFLKVFQAVKDFQGKSSLSTWIYRIATNYALMRLRSRKRIFEDLETEEQLHDLKDNAVFPIASITPLHAAENQELNEAMNRAIADLPDKFRSVFVLKDIEGYSLKEIATMLDLSLAAVKSNLHRARIFLRNRLADFASSN